MTGKNFRGDNSAKRHFGARVKEGYTREQFQTAIHNCLCDKFHKENPKYLTPEFITRPDKLEKYINYTPGGKISGFKQTMMESISDIQ